MTADAKRMFPDEIGEFERLAPAGFLLALRVGFAFPLVETFTFPANWVRIYHSEGLVNVDPVVRWLYVNTGSIRWSDVQAEDPGNVLGRARAFGLVHGAAVSCGHSPGARSFGSFARSDREFTDGEIAALGARIARLHEAAAPPRALTPAEVQALRMVKDGLMLKQIADTLSVSEAAIKLRLKNAKDKLDARNSTHAVTRAANFGLL